MNPEGLENSPLFQIFDMSWKVMKNEIHKKGEGKHVHRSSEIQFWHCPQELLQAVLRATCVILEIKNSTVACKASAHPLYYCFGSINSVFKVTNWWMLKNLHHETSTMYNNFLEEKGQTKSDLSNLYFEITLSKVDFYLSDCIEKCTDFLIYKLINSIIESFFQTDKKDTTQHKNRDDSKLNIIIENKQIFIIIINVIHR